MTEQMAQALSEFMANIEEAAQDPAHRREWLWQKFLQLFNNSGLLEKLDVEWFSAKEHGRGSLCLIQSQFGHVSQLNRFGFYWCAIDQSGRWHMKKGGFRLELEPWNYRFSVEANNTITFTHANGDRIILYTNGDRLDVGLIN